MKGDLGMVNPADIHGSRLAMIAWGKNEDGSDDVAVFTGTAQWDGQRLILVRAAGEPSFVVEREWLDRIRPVDPDLRSTLNEADYQFSGTIGPIPPGDDESQYLPTGLKWPTNEDAS